MTKKISALLLILDGWGIPQENYPAEANAIQPQHAPFWFSLLDQFPHTKVLTNGNAVGLPEGIMGNSEVGHLNLGAGRIVWQGITRIDKCIEEDGLMSRTAFVKHIEKARDEKKALHLMGLVSDGGVHSMDRHYFALLRLARKLGMPADRVFLHAFLDGRDTPPRSGVGYIEQLEKTMQDENLGRIAMVSGRYWAMDRDKRWDRVKRAYDAMVHGTCEFPASSGIEAVRQGYARDENDEFILPTVVSDSEGKPLATIQSGDQVIFFNFRPDRARQLSHALIDERFDGFERDEDLKIELTTMTTYENDLKADVAFPPENVQNSIGEYISSKGLAQLRIAETEKYAHVTYFFSGGREEPFDGEDRILVPSPKVPTYDLKPEMSVPEVAEKLEEAIDSGKYDLIICNFANGDMVGHSGIMDAAIAAVKAVDAAVKRVITAIQRNDGIALITADHGNAEELWNYEENCPSTQHSMNPTPALIVSKQSGSIRLRPQGCLADIAPTMLDLMRIEKPIEMTGESLIAG